MDLRISTGTRVGFCGLMAILLLAVSPQGQSGLGDVAAEDNDRFGQALAHGDFNGDGYADLAVGVPGEDIETGTLVDPEIQDAGAVEVIVGTANGLSSSDRQFWQQGGNLGDAPEIGDAFGCSLASGDFNNDGFDDLAIGVCAEDIDSITDAGAVHVIYGSASGLSATHVPDEFWYQSCAAPGSVIIPGAVNSCLFGDPAESDDEFGWSLAAGDFDVDGHDDLAIGIPGEDVGSIIDAGAVNVIYGSSGARLTRIENIPRVIRRRTAFLHQNSPGVADVAEPSDGFGYSLAAGRFAGSQVSSGAGDGLAIGVPWESVQVSAGGQVIVNAGAVNVIYGRRGFGLSDSVFGNEFWHQDTQGVEDTAEAEDHFGWSLAAANFNPEFGFTDDLAIGIPHEDIGSVVDAGAVQVIYGEDGRLSNGHFWHQDSRSLFYEEQGVEDTAEAGDFFGWSVATGDFAATTWFALAIGVPGENGGAGAVSVLYSNQIFLDPGFAAGSETPDQFWHQDISLVQGEAESNDGFGFALAAGRFSGDSHDDLAIGVPLETQITAVGAVRGGGVNVLYGQNVSGLFGGLTTAANQLLTQLFVHPPN